MGRPQNFTKDDFVTAALAIVDTEGLEALTFRRLGNDMGVSYTAVYTYFENKDALVTALMGHLLDEMLSGVDFEGSTPHDKLMKVGLGIRRVMAQHPLWITAFMTTATGPASDDGNAIFAVAAILEEAGIPNESLAYSYRAFEGFVLGSTAFDFSAAPEHLSSRVRRYKDSKHPAFVKVAKSEKSVFVHNEEAFAFGLDRLLTGLGI
jgi:TetR/AcrR family tetracycline transcriptional repressor